jgi:hypothetical protein
MEQNQLSELMEMQSRVGAKFQDAAFSIFIRPSIVESFRPCCVGHTFTKINSFPPDPLEYIVQDFLVDTSGLSHGGDQMEKLIQIGLNEATTIQYRVLLNPCKRRFSVKLPATIKRGLFSIELGRNFTGTGTGGFFDQYPATITFEGLSGNAPILDYNSFFITHGKNEAFYLNVSGSFTENFSFTGITITGRYPNRVFAPALSWFKPLSFAAPFGLPTSETTCFVLFMYRNPVGIATDLGPIISIL